MSPQLVALLANIFAAQARVTAMQAENDCREAAGSSPVYGEDAFLAQAHHLDLLANEARSAT